MKFKTPVSSFSSTIPRWSRRLIASAVAVLVSGPAFAVTPFTVSDIRIEGVQRVEAGTIFNYLPVKVGDTFSDEKGTAAIRALYGTGFFKDVRVEAQGNVVVVSVEENPTIASVEFTGTKEFDKTQLTKALKDIGVSDAKMYDRAAVDRAEQELKRQYVSRGFYGAQVTTTITPLERNRVAVNFNVTEGERARIHDIRFVGNHVYSDKTLRDQIHLTTPGLFTWYSKADQYTKEKLATDVDALRNYYLNHGYLEVQIPSTQVSITPDKKDIYITVNIDEGKQYTVSSIALGGETQGRDAELRSLIELKEGQLFSGKELTNSIRRITDRMGNFGYAFANVNANPTVDHEHQTVAFNFLLDPGKRVYVRNVNVTGNSKTRDEVVRREFRQFENSWYDGERIKQSRDRVDRLGFFKDVSVDTQEVPNTADQVDVGMNVTEKETGNIQAGLGFSQADKLSLSGGISQDNAFGSGNRVSLQANTSSYYRTISLSETNPYFTDDGISRTYEVYFRTQRPNNYVTGDYKVRTIGGAISYGVPFSEVDTVFFGIGVENTNVSTDASSPDLYKQYVTDFGNGSLDNGGSAQTTSFPLTVRWQRDSRDSALVPTRGRYQRFNFEISVVGSLRYYRSSYQHQYFKSFFDNSVTLALNGEIDYGRGIGKPYPVFKNYYAGGIGSVRGYEDSTLGSKVDQYGDSLGGASRLIGSAELQFPFPGSGQDRTLRWFTFLDGGNVFPDGQRYKLNDLRYSTGLGISWLSPIGPLKISYGFPLNAKNADANSGTPADKVQHFQFQIGNTF